jgi:anti-sigma factor RsiW
MDQPMTMRALLDRLLARHLPCVELVELVSDYLDGSLAPRLRSRIDAHLTGCDGCTTYVEQMRRVIEAARRLTADAVPPEAVDRLVGLFRAAGRP